MTTTLDNLERRVNTLETELIRLQKLVAKPRIDEPPADRGARLLREAKASQEAVSAGLVSGFREMGISGEPVGAEELQRMMIAGGVDPGENEFSREIIAMREE
jgi:hypothetical protein